MSTELGDQFALIDVLLRHKVSLAVIGGLAVSYHGYMRATEDVDVVVERTAENDSALLDALSELNAFWIGDELDPATGIERTHPVSIEYIRRSRQMMLGTRLGYLDIFDFVPGCPDADVRELIANADRSSGRPFVTLQWLRRMKQASGRPQDLEDLRHLPDC